MKYVCTQSDLDPAIGSITLDSNIGPSGLDLDIQTAAMDVPEEGARFAEDGEGSVRADLGGGVGTPAGSAPSDGGYLHGEIMCKRGDIGGKLNDGLMSGCREFGFSAVIHTGLRTFEAAMD